MARTISIISAIAVIFFAILGYNWLTNRDWNRFSDNLERQIKTIDLTLSSVQSEEVDLSKIVEARAATLLNKQQVYESKIAGESNERLRSVWATYKLGYFLNRSQVLKIGAKLAELQSATNDMRGTAVRGLESIEDVVIHAENPSNGSSDSMLRVKGAQDRIARLQDGIAVAIQVVAAAKDEVAEQETSLKEEQIKIQQLVPAGADPSNPITKEIINALDSALKENEATLWLLDRFDKSATSFGKAVFSVQDVLNTQAAAAKRF